MRRTLLALVPLLLVGPLSAQGFEGTIAMRMTMTGNAEPITTTMYIKGAVMGMAMTLPSSAGPLAGQQARMVLNRNTMKMTTLLPAPPGVPLPPGSKGMKMVTTIPNDADDETTDMTVKKLGTSQTIAGLKCDDYQTTSGDDVMNMCMTEQLGRFTLPTAGMGRSAPAWAHAFGDRPVFPLKVWSTTDGKGVAMEVTSVTRGAVPAEMIDDSAAGYVDMSAMMGGAGRN
jgi:hypothetical protein